MTKELKVLTGSEEKKQQGDFVLRGQTMDKNFSHVNAHWLNGTLTYEQGLQALEEDRAKTEDILATLQEVTPAVVDGNFVLQYQGRSYRPTKHAVGQIGGRAGTGTWYLQQLMENPENAKGVQLYSRDAEDAYAMKVAISNGFRRIKSDKKFFWRTRKDGTLRAMLTEKYGEIDNRWFIESLAKLVPNGRLSHWTGDADTVYGNVLIPDSIRKESDSDYGGMLSVGNSEIGERKIYTRPSIFRAICFNGCIWGATAGVAFKKKHLGKINLDELYESMKVNLEKQIPLLGTGIDKLLKTRSLQFEPQLRRPLFATFADQLGWSKKEASTVLDAFAKEVGIEGDMSRSLFGVINSITRAAQEFENSRWVKFDEIGGSLLDMDRGTWDNYLSFARKMDKDDVEAMFSQAT